jgi:shikimate dehydrogenase
MAWQPRSNPVLCGSIAGNPGAFGVTMHNAAYRALGLGFTYVAFGTEDTAGAVAAMRALGIRGLGVTMPHKIRIMPFLDELSEDACAIGAVNTVVNEGQVLVGHNVDWFGALDALAEQVDPLGKQAAVIGAGGGARAIAYALTRAGAAVTIYNRTAERGKALADRLGARFGGPPDALSEATEVDILIHATPAGTAGHDQRIVPLASLTAGMIVMDAVSAAHDTWLVREAKAVGCRIVPGIRMQLHQAVRQFELYTGVKPDLSIMEEALRLAIAGQCATPSPALPTESAR